MRRIFAATLASAFALAACSGGQSTAANESAENTAAMNEAAPGNMSEGAQTAIADLKTADGKSVGRVTATGTPAGIQVAVEVRDMPAGPHGAHIHTVGKCEGPKFESAGGHWNPATKKHGLENAAGPHAGDMPNLTVAADGTGSLSFTLPGGTFDGLFDADGSSAVIHEGADDMKTDPAGNSGGRVACGVFQRA